MKTSLRNKIIGYIFTTVCVFALALVYWGHQSGKISMFASEETRSVTLSSASDWSNPNNGIYAISENLLWGIHEELTAEEMKSGLYAKNGSGFYVARVPNPKWDPSPIKMTPENTKLDSISAIVEVPYSSWAKIQIYIDPHTYNLSPYNDDGWILAYEANPKQLGCDGQGICRWQLDEKFQQLSNKPLNAPLDFKIKMDSPATIRSLTFNWKGSTASGNVTPTSQPITPAQPTAVAPIQLPIGNLNAIYTIYNAPNCDSNPSGMQDVEIKYSFDNATQADGYDVVRVNLDGSTSKVFANVGPGHYTDKIPANTSYKYQASAYVASMNNGSGGHAYSNVVTVPQSCTGSAPAPAPVVSPPPSQPAIQPQSSGTFEKGFIDGADCNHIVGWACDPANYNAQLTIHIYDGQAKGDWSNNILNNVVANISNPADSAAISNLCGNSSAGHRFDVPTPDKLKDNKSHNIYAYPIHANTGSGDLPLASGVVNQSYVVMNACSAPTSSPIPTIPPTFSPTPGPTSTTQPPVPSPSPSPTTTLPPAPPVAPTNLKAEILSNSSIRLTWDKVTGADFYNIYNSNNSGIGAPVIGGVASTQAIQIPYTFTGLNCNQNYSYVVKAGKAQVINGVSTAVVSDISNVASAKTLACNSQVVDISNQSISNFNVIAKYTDTSELSWDKINDASGYDIFSCDGKKITSTENTNIQFPGLTCGSNQCYYVSAHSSNGSQSKSSDKKSITMPKCQQPTVAGISKGPATLSKTGASLWIDLAIALIIVVCIAYFIFRRDIWKPKNSQTPQIPRQ